MSNDVNSHKYQTVIATYSISQWSLRLNQALVEKIGMEQCKADPCVFRLRKDGETTMILYVRVDDIIVGGESEVCDALYASLLQKFQTTQGNSSWHLGCAIERNKAGEVLRMSQRAFVESVASRYGVDAVPGLRLPNPSRETKFSGTNAGREI